MDIRPVKADARVFSLELSVLRALCESTDSPRSLAVFMLVKHEEWKQLMALECDPLHYNTVDGFRMDYQCTEMLKKCPRVPLGIDRAEVAIRKFEEAEVICKETNARLELPIPPDFRGPIHHAREIAYAVLGPLTGEDLELCESRMGFGPGSTTSVSGVVTRGRKFSTRVVDSTPRVMDFGLHCLPAGWRKNVLGFRPVHASKLITVPKNAKTDRVICVEPDLNIFVQLGIGRLIKSKLKRSGLDLTRGQEVNRFLASKAEDWDLTTMDLSMASDSISRGIVWLLLPDRWCNLLEFARVDKTACALNGKTYELEKWSSMGNGYTFELETLLFWSIVRGCLRHLGISEKMAVAYGDDLIFPSQATDLVTRTLNFLGFKVNTEKTFGKGPFRESCGTDWFMGRDVRPVFLRSTHHDFSTVCYIYGNAISRAAGRPLGDWYRDSRFLPAWLRCFTAPPPSHRHRIPRGFGDQGFESSFDDAVPSVGLHSGYQRIRYGFSYRRIRPVDTSAHSDGLLLALVQNERGEGVNVRSDPNVNWQIAATDVPLKRFPVLHSMVSLPDATLGCEPLRGRFEEPSLGRGHVFAWPHLGPWL